jgi:ActR/RegA family two-component response regulator
MAYLMLVDDDEDFASAAAVALRSAGHEVNVLHDPAAPLPSDPPPIPGATQMRTVEAGL